MGKVVILNSRQSLWPVGNAPWVISSGEALREACLKGHTVLSSVGMSSWEIPFCWAARYGARQIVFIPRGPMDGVESPVDYYSRQFQLDSGLTEWNLIGRETNDEDRHWFRRIRDRLIIKSADIICPISIRPGGNLDNLIKEAEATGAEIDRRFQVEYQPDKTPHKFIYDAGSLNSGIDNRLKDHIIHWTRSIHAPWSGETFRTYYEAIINSHDTYPRLALHTLQRIIREKRLRASAGHYRRKFPAVSFSALAPSRVIPLMKWRARYCRMTMEPYGLALDVSGAGKGGIRPVIYGDVGDFANLAIDDQPYFQSHGRKGYWDPEKEWRHIGDLDFSLVPPENLKAVVWRKEEIPLIQSAFEGEVISLGS